MDAYATTADLAAYLAISESQIDVDAPRLLNRASELIAQYTAGSIDIANDTHVSAAQNATCAQVEYWLIGPGEDSDMLGAITKKTLGKSTTEYAGNGNPIVAPRAYRFLLMAGLLYMGASIR